MVGTAVTAGFRSFKRVPFGMFPLRLTVLNKAYSTPMSIPMTDCYWQYKGEHPKVQSCAVSLGVGQELTVDSESDQDAEARSLCVSASEA